MVRLRVQAFRRAARVASKLPKDELERRLAAGTPEELSGVGPATARAMTQAAAGAEPDRSQSRRSLHAAA